MQWCSVLPDIPRRRGVTAVLAMLFLVLFTSLAVAMFGMSSTNVQTAANLSDVDRARATAESGLHWTSYRFIKMVRPKTTIGNITADVADDLWPDIQDAIEDDLATMLYTGERPVTKTAASITSSPIAIDGGNGRFVVHVEQHPLDGGDPLDERYLRVTSTATYGSATRSVSMDFKIDKKVKFAVVGKTRIQLGRNTLVEGPIAMATASKYPPVLALSDFRHLDANLTNSLDDWDQFLKDNHDGYDNRISVNNSTEWQAAEDAGYEDTNEDNFIDEYDIFLAFFDDDEDKAISQAEFTNSSTGTLYDPELFHAIDEVGGPLHEDDPVRLGYQDGVIDNSDAYAKIRGAATVAATENAWSDWQEDNESNTIYDVIGGPIVQSVDGEQTVKFGASSDDIFDLSPANFEECANNFKARTGAAAGASVNTSTLKANITLTAAMANGGTATEKTPYGSTSYQATYKRPVFQNMTFRNVQIPKGLNAKFDNCTFEGVTWVDGDRDITTSSGAVTESQTEGMSWSKRRVSGDSTFSKDKVLVSSGTPSSGQMITKGSQKGNNIRFNNCTFEGPLAGAYATAYTHFANSWEFTGATMFNNQEDNTATIVSPQVNIEMGSFTDPTAAPSTLVGVVVAGNIDIRGTSIVDGSIIVTGDGAGNTTLGYFGASDGDTDAGANPEGGYGRLNIRYNPHRALPDGIDIAIDILPDSSTYSEGVQ
jgi:hypothetical protein